MGEANRRKTGDKTGDMVHKRQKDLKDIGQSGESMAADFLIRKGFKIIDRNYLKPWGEIDIVAQKGDWVHFVEVKTVSREKIVEGDYEPEDNLHPWKRKRLRRIIGTYLAAHELVEDWQVDAISVYINGAGEVLKLEWLEDIIL